MPSRIKLITAILVIVGGLVLGVLGKKNNENKVFLSVATASTGGTYYPIGVGLANIWSHALESGEIRVTGQSSAGSVENIDLLRKNEAQLAILQSLVAVEAYQGSGSFADNRYQKLRSISMLWPNVEHFLLQNSRVKEGTLSDIKGTRFSVGPQASGNELSTMLIMRGMGMSKADISPEYLGYGDTVSSMRDGRLDGGSLSAGVPAAAVIDMYASGMDARVLDVTDQQLAGVNAQLNSWFRFVIDANTYPRQTEAIATIAQPNILVSSVQIDDETIYQLTKTMFERLTEVRQIHSAAKYISLENALNGISVPLHNGAYRYYLEAGIDIPIALVPPEFML